MKNKDYLHDCLELHGEVAELRYGKPQHLRELESQVRTRAENGSTLWDVICTIHAYEGFPAAMFGFLPEAQIQAQLKEGGWERQWQALLNDRHVLVERLFEVFRQIEPVSLVLRFIDPARYGIMSGPVAAILGVVPRRRATDTYKAYLEALREVAAKRKFNRAADVEMALWALQVGALEDELLPQAKRVRLKESYDGDTPLQQLQTRNLTTHLFSREKLDIAESLLTTDVRLAGQIAGVEFEQLVRKRFGSRGSNDSLEVIIDRARHPDSRRLHDARDIRNRAVHPPRHLRRPDVERLIKTARWVSSL